MNSNMKIVAGLWAAVGLFAFSRATLLRMRRFPLANKIAIVTGGTRGLGLEITRQLVQHGSRVAICSRSEQEVDLALKEFEPVSSQVMGMVCDIRDAKQVQSFTDCVVETWGGVDLLFNVAGIMDVGPLESMSMNDFRESMETNCWGTLNVILSVLPSMRRERWGRIVNVASVGGKQAVPHMLPYTASKHALVGLSNGLRTELVKDGILVTTACPTLMRTGSPRNARFKGHHRVEFAWFDIAGSLPLFSFDSQSAAKQILQACQNGDQEVFIANLLNPVVWAIRLAPQLTAAILGEVNRLLPGPNGSAEEWKRGYESESRVAPSFLTKLNDDAARRNNEMPDEVSTR